jgi:hypothetical protein
MSDLPANVRGLFDADGSASSKRAAPAYAPTVGDDGSITIQVSSETPVPMRDTGVLEVLMHRGPENCDASACHSVLFHHDPNFILGPVESFVVSGGVSVARAKIMPDAMLPNGVKAIDAVRGKSLRGASLWYRYSHKDCTYDEKSNTLYVNKWRAMEVTLTPTPEDAQGYVRSANPPQGNTMTDPVIPAADPVAAPITPVPPVVDGARAAADAARAEVVAVVQLAESHGFRASEFAGLNLQQAKDKMLDMHLSKTPEPVAAGRSHVTFDIADKMRSAAENYVLKRCGMAKPDAQNPLNGRRFADAVKVYAEKLGIRGARDWSDDDACRFSMGKRSMMSWGARNAANTVSDMFDTFVTLDAVNKALVIGFDGSGARQTWPVFGKRRTVSDFRNYKLGTLATGNLEIVGENQPAPELSKSEGIYQNAIKRWAGTLSFSFEARKNDDMMEFARIMSTAGALAQRAVEKRVYQKLMMGLSLDPATATWTNNTTSGTIVSTTGDTLVAARANLDTVINAMVTKTDLSGNPISAMPDLLIVPSSLGNAARSIVGQVQPGQINGSNRSLEVLETPWLSSTILTGNSTTSYYLIARDVTFMEVTFLEGQEAPMAREYDMGAVDATGFLIAHYFEADAVALDGKFVGAHRGTT